MGVHVHSPPPLPLHTHSTDTYTISQLHTHMQAGRHVQAQVHACMHTPSAVTCTIAHTHAWSHAQLHSSMHTHTHAWSHAHKWRAGSTRCPDPPAMPHFSPGTSRHSNRACRPGRLSSTSRSWPRVRNRVRGRWLPGRAAGVEVASLHGRSSSSRSDYACRK